MIRWREEQECYRLEVSHSIQAGCLYVVGATLSVMIFVVVAIVMSQTKADPQVPWVVASVTLVIDAVIFHSANSFSKQHVCVEIWIRGGKARWSEGARMEMDYLEVHRFERVEGGWRGLGMDAVLPDGSRRRVFGLWRAFERRRLDKLLAQLNENLGEPPVA